MACKRLFGNGPNSILVFIKKLEKCFWQSSPLWFSFVLSLWTQSMWCYGRVGSHVSWCGNARPPRTFLLSLPPPSYYPPIIAPTILLSSFHCPYHFTSLLSLPPTILLSCCQFHNPVVNSTTAKWGKKGSWDMWLHQSLEVYSCILLSNNHYLVVGLGSSQ